MICLFCKILIWGESTCVKFKDQLRTLAFLYLSEEDIVDLLIDSIVLSTVSVFLTGISPTPSKPLCKSLLPPCNLKLSYCHDFEIRLNFNLRELKKKKSKYCPADNLSVGFNLKL